jgi:membrane protein implicated in regulation of membrane protease activity
MNWQDFFLICFVVGFAWSMLSLLLGGLHLHLPKFGIHGIHSGSQVGGHTVGSSVGHGHAGTTVKMGSLAKSPGASSSNDVASGVLSGFLNPSAIAIFLAWFGGAGYLLTRHALIAFWLVIFLSVVTGLAGAFLIAYLMFYLQSKERPMDPADYEMMGVLGQVAAPVRPGGTGEMIFARDGSKHAVPVRSENGQELPCGAEVIVTRFDQGIAYVRTWEDMADHSGQSNQSTAQR